MELAAILVSLLAVAVSALFAWRGEKTSKRVTAIEEARRQEEVLLQQTADVTARIDRERYPETVLDRTTSKTTTTFVVHNRGHAPARDVTATISEDSGPRFEKHLAARFPLAFLDAGAEFAVPLFITMRDHSSQHTAHLEWSDERGRHAKDVTLALV
ncbi:MAG TPA: hypothetical protein VNA57_03900 [Acidimicrobiales bacterium]|nr:hypothetical protein [Acidimicrobiales bacterium]